MTEQEIKYYRPKVFKSVLKQFQQDAKKLEMDGWKVVSVTRDVTFSGAALIVVYEREKPPEQVPQVKPEKKKSYRARLVERQREERRAFVEPFRKRAMDKTEELKKVWSNRKK